ncbi:2342_t:CDS:2 [Funneliformis caledonium]|uniref:2342_t:CDS:1 n=1 Tax=Funneliformis caledonium TaxID=1117310 RepID=A0A9N9F3V3_9GLOM|nr:2342_t:CDS:2 [Funneliformis caledonium]
MVTVESPTFLSFASSGVVLGGHNNNFIFVVGGAIIDPFSQDKIVNEQILLEYDILNNKWRRIAMSSAPNLNWRVQFVLLSDNNGKAYLHGGHNGKFLDNFSSVLLNDGRLVIIGGYGCQRMMFPHIRPIG